jgi:hypothetical protein
MYWLLQHLSSVLGLAVLTAWAAVQLQRSPAAVDRPREVTEPGPRLSMGLRLGAIVALFASSAALALVEFLGHPHSRFDYRLFHTATGGMAGWVFAWCIVALLINLRLRREST